MQTIFDKCNDKPFNGLVFIKFELLDKCNETIQVFNSSKFSMFGKVNYMWPDLPLQQRVPKPFLGSVKGLLVEWNFSAPSVSYDPERQSVAVVRKFFV